MIETANFYSTYEALKLKIFVWKLFTHSQFLLYLWGIETHLFHSLKLNLLWFLLYLWGIETLIPLNLNSWKIGFLLYLWGIETRL